MAREDHPTTAFLVAPGPDVALPSARPDALVVGVDAGTELLRDRGWPPQVVVGDLDSISEPTLRWARDAGAEILRHPVDKDATDLELALVLALERGVHTVEIHGGTGGRISHLLGNVAVVASPRFSSVEVTWHVDGALVLPCHPHRPRTVAGVVGDLVSLVPLGGPARGVCTFGLRWALDDDDLDVWSTRGVSNELEAPVAEVRLRRGTLLVVHERSRP